MGYGKYYGHMYNVNYDGNAIGDPYDTSNMHENSVQP